MKDGNDMDIYVSSKGSDSWSGYLPEQNAAGTDGPFLTIEKARDLIRDIKNTGRLDGPVNVWIRGGRYVIDRPLVFTSEDSAPACYRAYSGEQPIIDGGRRIHGWKTGMAGRYECWTAEIPEVKEGRLYFRQLFVNGERRERARSPKKGFYRMESVPAVTAKTTYREGQDAFIASPGDFDDWKNIGGVEIITFLKWIEERMHVASYDRETRLVTLSSKSTMAFIDDYEGRQPRYYIDNVFEALSEPGEWYLDRNEGKLYYIPMPGEEPDKTEVFAPVLTQLLRLEGSADGGRRVEFLGFDGLVFEHSDWNHENQKSGQSACNVPGAISMKSAYCCAVKNCRIRHTGFYGIEIGEGCIGNMITGNEICDLGAGGIKMGGTGAAGPSGGLTGNNTITNNSIYSGGRIFYSACGILSMHSFGNRISHNHIYDFYYTGISCGWVWGYADSVSKDNRIEKNHIHDIGHGLLCDMGGIYMLGVQPGTVIRGNIVHDIEKYCYGGWGIYTDEGSSHMLIENNISYRTGSQCFHQHYGRENILRNNIFVFGNEGNLALTRTEEHLSFTVERNIFVTAGPPVFVRDSDENFKTRCFISDLNLFWSAEGDIAAAGGWGPLNKDSAAKDLIDMDKWKSMGYDTHSVYADPGFIDIGDFNFELKQDSPAFSVGFLQIDTSDVGPEKFT
jgi:hypothetical protein